MAVNPLLVASLALAGSLAGLWALKRNQAQEEGPAAELILPVSAKPPCPKGCLPTMTAGELFREVRADPLIYRITQSLGFAPENYQVDVQPLLDAVAEFVQLLPASESHHHANPGGLLTHLLEVSAIALLRAEETKLPIGRPTEEQLKHAARWRYGILVAALLHDIGKPIADVIVTVFDGERQLSWSGLAGPIPDFGQCYAVSFPLKKDYGAHQKLPVMLLKHLLPRSTLRWLSEDVELVPALVAYLAGETDGGIIGKLVKEADGKSVADNLLLGVRTRFATARQVPVIERLMAGMRRMLSEGGHLPLNRDGAAGFCDGQSIWFVAGTLADKVRAYLDKSEIRELGAANLPTDNSRLFDVWLDYGACAPNGTQAIWRVEIELLKQDGHPWKKTLTCLKFPLEVLYQSSDQYPISLNGSIRAVEGGAEVEAGGEVKSEGAAPAEQGMDAPSDADSFELEKSPSVGELEAQEAHVGSGDVMPVDSDVILLPDFDEAPIAQKAPTEVETPAAVAVADEYLDADDSAATVLQARPAHEDAQHVPSSPTAPVAPGAVKPPENSLVVHSAYPEADEWLAWVQHGVSAGTIKYNRASAFVHFVQGGILIISPKAFRQYLEFKEIEVDGNSTQVKKLQQAVQKSGYVAKNGDKKSYLFHYRITNPSNPARQNVSGYLIPDPGRFFNPVPALNMVLEPSPGNSTGGE